MISVSIFINGNPIYTRSAVNQKETSAKGNFKYLLDDGSTLIHKRDDGAVVLAKKMLSTIKEV